MVDDIDITTGDYKFRVTGLRDAVKNLQAAGVDAQDIKELMQDAGEIVARRASWLAPARTGRLRDSMRVGKAKTKATIRVGGARVPYARFVYFGKYNEAKGGLYAKKNPFIWDALNATRPQVYNRIELGIRELLAKNNLT